MAKPIMISVGVVLLALVALIVFQPQFLYEQRDWQGERGILTAHDAVEWNRVRPHMVEEPGEMKLDSYNEKIEKLEKISWKAYKKNSHYWKPWPTPQQVEEKGAQCVGKNLWTWNEARKVGFKSIRFVLGYHHNAQAPNATTAHAWLLWFGPRGPVLVDASGGSGFVCEIGFWTSSYDPRYSLDYEGNVWEHGGKE